ncbi:MAG: flagellar hook-length control protein FliK [Pseudomonadota bacterium]
MNAGLLGEHLASPRTATKTNQSTALDPKTAKSGDSSSSDEFASYVNNDAAPAQPDGPAEEAAVAHTSVPDTVPQTHVQTLGLDGQPTASDALIEGEAEAVDPTKLNVAATADPAAVDAGQAADTALRTTRGDAQLNAPQPDQAAEFVAQDPRIRSHTDSRETTRDSRAQTIKLGETTGTTSSEVAARSTSADQLPLESHEIHRNRAETLANDAETPQTATSLSASDANSAETALRQSVSTDTTAVDRLISGTVARDGTTIIPDTVTSVAAATPTSTPTVAPTTGLTPTAPSIPLATPNELTGVILNAINNGIDPQEQLVVQLDPPELGRVMIDFKFDAQGLQQITVTTENPEALKRLREMHFELTQALRDHGLSEQNMSFREQAGEQSQQNWGSSESSRQEAPLFAAEDRRPSPSAVPVANNTQSRDRLDLLL